MSKELKVIIHYWSATGNTRCAALAAKEELEKAGAEVEMRNALEQDFSGFENCGLWVVAAPVFSFRPALVIDDLIRRAKETGSVKGIKATGILTYAGFAGRAGARLGKMFTDAGAEFWELSNLVCEDSWPVTRKIFKSLCDSGKPTAKTLHDFREFWKNTPRRLAENNRLHPQLNFPTPLDIFALFFRKEILAKTFPLQVDMQKCTSCGKCTEICPTGRMKLENFPKPKGNCTGCYACVNICPVEAVNSIFTRNAKRYQANMQNFGLEQ